MNEWIIVGIIAFLVLIVGGSQIPKLARGVGQAMIELRRARASDDDDEA
jgi:Sec-independent protein translocase protein TatA